MLVLSRKQGEGIVIDRNITIRVLGVHGRKIRVGVEAPREMSVLREELECLPMTGMVEQNSSSGQEVEFAIPVVPR